MLRNSKVINIRISRKTEFIIVWVLLLAATAVTIRSVSQTFANQEYNNTSVDLREGVIVNQQGADNVLYVANYSDFSSSYKDNLKTWGIYSWDLIIFGGNVLGEVPREELEQEAAKYAAQVEFIDGTEDTNNNTSPYSVITLNNSQHVLINQSRNNMCEFTDEQLESLKNTLANTDSANINMYMYRPMWPKVYVNNRNDQYPCDDGQYWKNEIAPLIDGRVKNVFTGNTGNTANFQSQSKKSVRYISAGSSSTIRNASGSKASRFIQGLRINSKDEFTLVNQIPLAAPSKIRTKVDYPEYSVTMDETSLKEFYMNAPFTDLSIESPVENGDWISAILLDSQLEELQKEYDAQFLLGNGNRTPVKIRNRGNTTIHWQGLKKSWNISFEDIERKQIKLILPYDRGYIRQMFVQDVNEAIDMLTPGISVARLNINGYDFGFYLQYEDFDKAFIETNTFNSDAPASKNIFRDEFGVQSIDKSINNIDYGGKSNDKTYLQNFALQLLTPENINDYFDQDQTAKWVAVQTYAGDGHQNQNDNLRFFLDRATGKYIMVTWDLGFARPKGYPLPEVFIQRNHFDNPKNKQIVLDYMQSIVDQNQMLTTKLDNLLENELNLFKLDPMPNHNELRIENIGRETKNKLRLNNNRAVEFITDER